MNAGEVHFRVWSPRRSRVDLLIGINGANVDVALEPEHGGYISGHAPQAVAETLYRVRLDRDAMLYLAPASRYQPDGPQVQMANTTTRGNHGI